MDSSSTTFRPEDFSEALQAQDPRAALAEQIGKSDAQPLRELRAGLETLVTELKAGSVKLLERMLQACPEGTPEEARAFITHLLLNESDAVQEALDFEGEPAEKARRLAEALNEVVAQAKKLVDATRANVGVLTGQTPPAPAEDPVALARNANRTTFLSDLTGRAGIDLSTLDDDLERNGLGNAATRFASLLTPAETAFRIPAIQFAKLPVADVQLKQTEIESLKRDEEREFRSAMSAIGSFAREATDSFDEMMKYTQHVLGRFFMKLRKKPLVSNVNDFKGILGAQTWLLNDAINPFNFETKVERPQKRAELAALINNIIQLCAPDESPKSTDEVVPPAVEPTPPPAAPVPAPVAAAAASAGRLEDPSRRTLLGLGGRPPVAPATEAVAPADASAGEPGAGAPEVAPGSDAAAPAPVAPVEPSVPLAAEPAAPEAALLSDPPAAPVAAEIAAAPAAAPEEPTAWVDEPAESAPVEFEAPPAEKDGGGTQAIGGAVPPARAATPAKSVSLFDDDEELGTAEIVAAGSPAGLPPLSGRSTVILDRSKV